MTKTYRNGRNKTVLVVILTALLPLLFILPAASAQVTVSIENASACQNAITVTQIIAHNVTDLGAFGLSLEYDPDVVIVLSAENNPQLPDQWGITDLSKHATGYVGIASSQLPPYPSVSGDVVLSTITLEAVGEPSETSPLNITIGKLYKSDGVASMDAIDIDRTFTIPTLTTPSPSFMLSPSPSSSPTSTPSRMPTPTPTPILVATPAPTPTVVTPSVAPHVTQVPTATGTPTPPPEEPGFEAVFAIAGLLAVAYLVLRRKKR